MAALHAWSGTRRVIVILWRALLLHCPACGSDTICESWFKLEERCPGCGASSGNSQLGHQVAAFTLNLLIPFAIWSVVYAGILVTTWPDPPWEWLTWATVILMLALPLAHYPLSHILVMALDVLFHPNECH